MTTKSNDKVNEDDPITTIAHLLNKIKWAIQDERIPKQIQDDLLKALNPFNAKMTVLWIMGAEGYGEGESSTKKRPGDD